MKQKRLTVLIDEDLHKKVKMEALKADESIKEFIVYLINEYFSKEDNNNE